MYGKRYMTEERNFKKIIIITTACEGLKLLRLSYNQNTHSLKEEFGLMLVAMHLQEAR